MPWDDYLVDRCIDDDTLAALLAEFLQLDHKQIAIVPDIAAATLSDTIQLVCERRSVQGDFVLNLSIYARTPDIQAANGEQFVAALCDATGCRCLVSDDSLNPFSYILMQSGGRRSAVTLSSKGLLKDPEEYVLDS